MERGGFMNFITNIGAWLLKNGNMLVGVVTALVKVVCGVINIFQPDKDDLVDTIQEWGEKIQEGISKATKIAKNFK